MPDRPRSYLHRGLGAALAFVATAGVATAARAQTVGAVAARGACATSGVAALSDQLVATQMCLMPGAFVTFVPHANVRLTNPAIYAFLAAPARDALWHASGSLDLQVNSAFRTIADQYVLYFSHACALAATPGNSNHETGRAVDLENWSAAIGPMTAAGCTHTYPSTDPVHFDCPGDDMRAVSIRAFQHLWNVNHPGDMIAEDGAYGPMTESRLAASPAGGFADPGGCAPATPAWGAAFVMQSFPLASAAPIVLHVGETRVGYIELRNTGSNAWDAHTRLATTVERDRTSALAGEDWVTPARPAGVTGTVAPGATYRFMFALHGNTVGSYDEHFGMVEEAVAWFSDTGEGGPPDDMLQLRVDVVAAVDEDAGLVPDASDVDADARDAGIDARRLPDGALDPGASMEGCGCAVPGRARGAGSRGATLALALGAALGLARRRRRRRA